MSAPVPRHAAIVTRRCDARPRERAEAVSGFVGLDHQTVVEPT